VSSQERRFIPIAHPWFIGNEKKYVNECIDDVWVSSAGRFIGDFERAFADRFGVRHAIGTNNGTTALHVALVSLGIGEGDEVIVPTLTYIASANAVRYCGAKPVFVDSEPQTWNLDPQAVAAAITPRTKAILPVHLYGHPADMQAIMAIAQRHNLAVVEDAAEAIGARAHGHYVGGIGTIATFSFFGNKIITTGEGGMVVTNDTALAERVRLYRGQGMDSQRRYWFPVVGYNYRITNIEAAIGLAQLERYDDHAAKRATIAGWYSERLGAHGAHLFDLPVTQPWAEHAYWIYTLVLRDDIRHSRDDVMAAMTAAGIETRPVFYPMHVMPPYREPDGSYPVAERIGKRGISLPTHGLLTEDDVDYICSTIVRIATA
jgi:perosamine synthetase